MADSDSGVIRVASILNSVVLPAPFSPSRPKNSPARTSHDTSDRARTDSRALPLNMARQPRCLGNDFVSPRSTTAELLEAAGVTNALAPAGARLAGSVTT